MAGPPDQKKVAALKLTSAKAKWLSNQASDGRSGSSAPEEQNTSFLSSSTAASSTNAVTDPSDVAAPTSSFLPAENQPFALDDLSAAVKEFLLASRRDLDPYNDLYTLDFKKAVDIFGADKFVSGPEGREMLHLGTDFFECAQKAGMPGGIFRWLQGEPMDTIGFQYPSSHIDRVMEQLTA